MRSLLLVLLAGAMTVPVVAQEAGEPEPELLVVESSVDLGPAEAVEVAVLVGVADVEVEGGTDKLAEARFEVSDSVLVPEFTYEEEEGRGSLELVLATKDLEEGEGESEWHVWLNAGVLTELDVQVGVGRCEVELGWMPKLEEAEVSVGAGQLVVDCSGAWDHSPDVLELEVGVGDCHITVPDNVGVFVAAEAGLGDIEMVGLNEVEDGWANELWGKADVNLEIEAAVGIGDLLVEVAVRE